MLSASSLLAPRSGGEALKVPLSQDRFRDLGYGGYGVEGLGCRGLGFEGLWVYGFRLQKQGNEELHARSRRLKTYQPLRQKLKNNDTNKR